MWPGHKIRLLVYVNVFGQMYAFYTELYFGNYFYNTYIF